MSRESGRDVAKVKVGKENDMKLRPAGKRCAQAGLPNLPGGLMRCHSMPGGMALTCPSGWLAEELTRMKHTSAEHRETLRATSASTASLHNGTAGDLRGSIRPCTVATERAPGGGRSQGARTMRPSSAGAARGVTYDNYMQDPPLGYDSRRHGWHDPRGQLEQTRLQDPPQGNSYAWKMRKARDHTGYGDDGMVSSGDCQCTAVSGNGPAWFIGTKTVPGPFTTNTVPIRRCPEVGIEGKEMKIRGKTYEQGDYLNTHETTHGQNTVPEKVRKTREPHPMDLFNKARYHSLVHGGCQTKPNPYPLSRHISREGRTQRKR